jgi:hypothetical protein
MAERQVGLRIMLEHQHFLQIAPINETEAKHLMEQVQEGQVKAESRIIVTGHSFTEEGQPWKFTIPSWRVVGMHTFSLEQKQAFAPGQPRPQAYTFGRS